MQKPLLIVVVSASLFGCSADFTAAAVASDASSQDAGAPPVDAAADHDIAQRDAGGGVDTAQDVVDAALTFDADAAPDTPPDVAVEVCAPVSMATACAGRQCGAVNDGCGGSYDCGTCPAPESCGYAGHVGMCGAAPVACKIVSQAHFGETFYGCNGANVANALGWPAVPGAVGTNCPEFGPSTLGFCPAGNNCSMWMTGDPNGPYNSYCQ